VFVLFRRRLRLQGSRFSALNSLLHFKHINIMHVIVFVFERPPILVTWQLILLQLSVEGDILLRTCRPAVRRSCTLIDYSLLGRVYCIYAGQSLNPTLENIYLLILAFHFLQRSEIVG